MSILSIATVNHLLSLSRLMLRLLRAVLVFFRSLASTLCALLTQTFWYDGLQPSMVGCGVSSVLFSYNFFRSFLTIGFRYIELNAFVTWFWRFRFTIKWLTFHDWPIEKKTTIINCGGIKINNRKKNTEKSSLLNVCSLFLLALLLWSHCWLGNATTLFITVDWLNWRCQTAVLFGLFFVGFSLFVCRLFAPLFLFHLYFVLFFFSTSLWMCLRVL